MIDDILTVTWKERRELFRYEGRRVQVIIVLLMPLLLAIQAPLSAGLDWVHGYDSLMYAAIIPVFLVGTTIPDSFAGERQRHRPR